MNVLSNLVLRVVFDNSIHSNYAFSAKLQFDQKSIGNPDLSIWPALAL